MWDYTNAIYFGGRVGYEMSRARPHLLLGFNNGHCCGRYGWSRGFRTRARCKLELLSDLVVVASLLRGRTRTRRAGAGAPRELDFPLE